MNEQDVRDILNSMGLYDMNITTYEDINTINIRISKPINGERHYFEQSFSTDRVLSDSGYKFFEDGIKQMARKMLAINEEKFSWDDNVVMIDYNDSISVRCFRCGATAELDSSCRTLSKHKQKMTLLALLKEECDPICGNSVHDRKF